MYSLFPQFCKHCDKELRNSVYPYYYCLVFRTSRHTWSRTELGATRKHNDPVRLWFTWVRSEKHAPTECAVFLAPSHLESQMNGHCSVAQWNDVGRKRVPKRERQPILCAMVTTVYCKCHHYTLVRTDWIYSDKGASQQRHPLTINCFVFPVNFLIC